MFSAKLILFVGILVSSSWISAQVTEKQLEEVQVEENYVYKTTTKTQIQSLDRKKIEALKVNDAGELMQKFAGVSLKNYGGLGGLKTISVRGIGGSHTALVIDGFLLQNSQSAQVDLGTIPVENMERISFSLGGLAENLLPISAYLSGSSISIQRYENQFSSDTFSIRSSTKVGSFGQLDQYLGAKFSQKRFFFSAFGKYRTAQGKYPFSLQNGNQVYQGKRINNDLNEFYSGFFTGIRIGKNALLKFSYQGNVGDKGLPGAVILYNSTAVQRLGVNSNHLNVDFRWVLKRFSLRNYLSFSDDKLQYEDHSYLNEAGFLKQTYWNQNVVYGISMKYNPKNEKHEFYGGVEQIWSRLIGENSFFGQVHRLHLKSVFGWSFTEKKWRSLVQFGAETLENRSQLERNSKQALSSYALIESVQKLRFIGTPSVWIKRSFRMPSFNELYYNQIGNTKLKPEIANQLNVGTNYFGKFKKWETELKFNAYLNLIENKIVAIPTKNLFVWSMQNVGVARAIGGDVQFSLLRSWEKHKVSFLTNYSFQSVRDWSNSESNTFKHQLPYLPLHTANFDVKYSYLNSTISLNQFFSSSVFVLNENIESNRLAGFYTMDLVFNQSFKFKKYRFDLSFAVKNSLNASYSFVRYYVMPGRNYLISLSFEI